MWQKFDFIDACTNLIGIRNLSTWNTKLLSRICKQCVSRSVPICWSNQFMELLLTQLNTKSNKFIRSSDFTAFICLSIQMEPWMHLKQLCNNIKKICKFHLKKHKTQLFGFETFSSECKAELQLEKLLNCWQSWKPTAFWISCVTKIYFVKGTAEIHLRTTKLSQQILPEEIQRQQKNFARKLSP